MQKSIRQILSGLLVLAMVLSLIPTTVFAEETSAAAPLSEITIGDVPAAVVEDGRLEILSLPASGATVNISDNGDYPWVRNGNRLQSSNQGIDNTSSETTISFTLDATCRLSFDYGVSSESGYDKLTISLNNEAVVNAISGNEVGSFRKVLEPGSYSLTLRYTKDSSVYYNNDIGYIENYVLTDSFTTQNMAEGKCGDDVSWVLTDEGTLIISGTGAMANSYPAPWYDYRSQITAVVFGDGVTSIDDEAFRYCSNLISVTIPRSVTSIGSWAFGDCSSLTEIWVSEDNPNFYSDESGVLYNKSITTLILCPSAFTGVYEIPDGVISIGSYAFYGCNRLTSVSIPDSVAFIGEYAFCRCSCLTGVTIPDSVTYIGESAFYDCNSLVSLVISHNATQIEPYTFRGCTSLKDIEIPDSVTIIGDSAFASCSNLTSITIPSSVISIGYAAFRYCTSLAGMIIPSSVVNISSSAFSGCSSLKNVIIPNSVTTIASSLFYDCSNLTSIVIPDSVASIGDDAFCYCENLSDLVIGNSVSNIGSYAFENCSSLTSIVIPDSVTSIGINAFAYCNSLTSITFEGNAPQFEKNIFGEEDCFYDVTATAYYPDNAPTWTEDIRHNYGGNITWVAENMTIASGICGLNLTWQLTKYGTLTIRGNGKMDNYSSQNSPWYINRNQVHKLEITNGITSIGDYAFNECNITSAVIPDSVTSIGNFAFSDCKNLIGTRIPASVSSIGKNAFSACDSLEYMYFDGNAPTFGEDCFASVVATAYYPENALNWTEAIKQNYGGDIGWFSGSPVIASGSCGVNLTWQLTKDGNLTVSGIGEMGNFDNQIHGGGPNCIPWENYQDAIQKCLLESGVTSIGSYAFSGCFNLTSIVIPNTITSIGSSAFNWCSSLATILIPSSVSCIGRSAFYQCNGLSNIVFEGDAPRIESYCFYYVTANANYPTMNPTWTEEVRQNYSGTITWIPYEPQAHEHQYSAVVTAPTCTEGGFATYTCTCGESYVSDETAALGHTWDEGKIITQPTEQVEGVMSFTCTRCGETRTESIPKLEVQVFAITKQPEIYVGPIGSTASFHVEAAGSGLTYQWYYSPDNVGWSASSSTGAKTDTLKVSFTANRAGQFYRCEIRNDKGEVLTSDAVFMCEKLPPITIQQQPESFMGKSGEIGVFQVKASGEGLTYQWYYSKDNGVTWSKSGQAGSTTDTMNIQLTMARAGQCYRCEITDADGNILNSEQAAIKLETENIEIKYQPVSANGYIGETTSFHVEATGMGLTYQWYYSKNGGQTWSPSGMAGCDTDTLKVQLTAARVGQSYRCAVTDNKGNTVYSDVVAMKQKISVVGVLEINAQPKDFTGKVGDTAVFYVDAIGENLVFQWQFSKDGKTWDPSGLPGSKTDTLRVEVTTSRIGQHYRCVITDAKGKQIISNPVTLYQA